MTIVDSERVSFAVSESTLTVRDELDTRTATFEVTPQPSLRPALVDLFQFPVDAAVSFDAETLSVGPNANILVRDDTGAVLDRVDDGPRSYPRGTYYVDINAPVRVYLRLAETEPTLCSRGEPETGVEIAFGSETTVTVGARSLHTRPEATITVPDDPEKRIEAFSYLGSSIKEFSPERAWADLRGYPPRFERGETLSIPSTLSKPETGVTVTVPPTHAALYRIAPLAFYVGATVEAGETPALDLPNGYSEPLVTRQQTLEESVEAILYKCLVLDALVRGGGYVPVTIRAYEDVAPHLPFYPESLVDEPFGVQLMEYLEAPTAPVLDALPDHTTTAVLRPDPDDVTLLPGLLDSFASIRVAESPPAPEAVRERSRSSPAVVGYAHSSVPQGGLALRTEAFDRVASDTAPEAGAATVALVTGNPTRAARLRAALDRAPLASIPERIRVQETPSRSELRTLLTGEIDLLVLDLPATERTITCRDGALDLGAVDTVDARIVALDAAPEAGAVDPAVASTLARMGAAGVVAAPGVTTPKRGLRLVGCLLKGQPLPAAADLVYDGGYYLAGSAVASVARLDRGINAACFYAETIGPDEHRLQYETYPSRRYGQGSVNIPPSEFGHGEYQLTGTTTAMPSTVSTEQLLELLGDGESIVVLNGEVCADAIEPTRDLVDRSTRRASTESSSHEPNGADRRSND